MAACYSPRLDEAIALAVEAFRDRCRKDGETPYLMHLLQVLVTVGEHHGDEDQMVAAVLHDYLEDIEGATAQELSSRFGARVASMVVDLSDSSTHPKPPWHERKRGYVSRLSTASHDVKLICAADKLHNATSTLRDYRAIGDRVWERFTAGRRESLWYYRAIVDALSSDWTHPLLEELTEAVKRLHDEAGVEERWVTPANAVSSQ